MADNRPLAPRQLELPLAANAPSPEERRAKWAELVKLRKAMEYRRLLRDSQVEFEQLPN